MATLQSITILLKDIQENIALLIGQEAELNEQIELLSRENNKLRTYLKQDQPSPPEASLLELPSYNPSREQQQPLLAIVNISNIVIDRNMTLLSNKEELSKLYRLLKIMVPEISIKEYIMNCNTDIKKCYDNIDTILQSILEKNDKQKGQETIFQKGYLLYDLIRQNPIEKFIELLIDTRKIYNTVIHEPQTGGASSTLLQVIGLTKIKAIIKFMNNNTEYNFDIHNVDNANALIDNENIIIAIAQFFYKQPIMLS